MLQIFISYRRADSQQESVLIFQRLSKEFGTNNVFFDIDRIRPGERWEDRLRESATKCHILLTPIGPRWLEEFSQRAAAGVRDHLRDEIEKAIQLKKRIVRLQLGNVNLPSRSDLTPEWEPFYNSEVVQIRPLQHFSGDMAGLVQLLRRFDDELIRRRTRELANRGHDSAGPAILRAFESGPAVGTPGPATDGPVRTGRPKTPQVLIITLVFQIQFAIGASFGAFLIWRDAPNTDAITLFAATFLAWLGVFVTILKLVYVRSETLVGRLFRNTGMFQCILFIFLYIVIVGLFLTTEILKAELKSEFGMIQIRAGAENDGL